MDADAKPPFLSSAKSSNDPNQRPLTIGDRDHCTVVSSSTRLDLTNKENMLSFVCSEAVESELVKLDTSCPTQCSLSKL